MDDSLPLWRSARTYADLCSLGARFLAGEDVGFPGWLPGDIDEETDEQADLLARAHHAGYLTLASQPGSPESPGADGRLERRRAFVFGFAPEPLAQALERAARGAQLWSRSFPAQEAASGEGAEAWPVACRGEDIFLAVGDAQGPVELELFAEALGPGPAMEELRATRYVVLVDPDWGRDDRLWPALAQALP